MIQELKEKFSFIDIEDEETVVCDSNNLLELFEYLKNFTYLRIMDIISVHFPSKNQFLLIYHLQNLKEASRLFVKVRLQEKRDIISIIGVYPNAAWYEREIHEMFGINFIGNPNLEYLLLSDKIEFSHPLLKDNKL